VFPSRWEVFGIVCLEAMALGCPVLVSIGTGLEEVLGTDLSEYAVDISVDEDPLTEKLLKILREPSHYRNSSQKFRQKALEIINMGEKKIVEIIGTPSPSMRKNISEAVWKQYSETLMLLFSNVWDSAESAHERLYKNRFQIYFFKNGETSESNSRHCYYPMSRWSEVAVDLPAGIAEGNLRMDPSDRPGTVFIKRITIKEATGGETIFTADGSNGFSGCSVLMDDAYEYDGDALVIHARTEDPQIMLNTPSVSGPVVVKANICFQNEVRLSGNCH
jgi:hypothetical protein